MKRFIYLLATSVTLVLFSFSSSSKTEKVPAGRPVCGSPLWVSNQSSGSARVYRVTWYAIGQNKSKVVNLFAGQSKYLDYAPAYYNEITVQTVGSFSYLNITDVMGNEIARVDYNGSNYYIISVDLNTCFDYYTINMF